MTLHGKKMQLRIWPGTVVAGLHRLDIFRYVINLSEAEIYLGKLRKADSTEKREQLIIILFPHDKSAFPFVLRLRNCNLT